MENKAFKIAGIKLLIKKNYDVPVDLIDLEALVDESLTMRENWFNIKRDVLDNCRKPHKILFTR